MMIEQLSFYNTLTSTQKKELLVTMGAAANEQAKSFIVNTPTQCFSPSNRSDEVAPTSSDSPPKIDNGNENLTMSLTTTDNVIDKHVMFSSSRYRITSKERRDKLLLDIDLNNLLERIIEHVCQIDNDNGKLTMPNEKGDKTYFDWLYYLDQMRKTDKIELPIIQSAWEWVSSNDFWSKTIISTAGFRRNWAEIKRQYDNAENNDNGKKQLTTTDKRKKDKEKTYGKRFFRNGVTHNA